MDRFMERSALDSRFVDLAILMSLGVWPWIAFVTFGGAFFAWKLVILCHLIALPFAIAGWAIGFQNARKLGWSNRRSAMAAGWTGLIVAQAGLAIVQLFWMDGQLYGSGFLAFPALAVLVTTGVLWFYRGSTWAKQIPPTGV
jgi:hypothetical protein